MLMLLAAFLQLALLQELVVAAEQQQQEAQMVATAVLAEFHLLTHDGALFFA